MEAKIRAQELVEKYMKQGLSISLTHAKQCALISIDELIESTFFGIDLDLYEGQYNENCKEYWQEVKTELENL